MTEAIKIKTFYDLIAWQKAKLLCVDVYRSTKHIDYRGYNNEIQRASVSVMNNIAEGLNVGQIKNLFSFCISQKVRADKFFR